MHPYHLIGLKYRLGASPEKHGAADCLTLTQAVLNWHGIETPKPKRSWYRRLYKKDFAVFNDELSVWGQKTNAVNIGTVALCKSDRGFGLASYFEDGWISFKGLEAGWSRIDALMVVELYCPMNSISVIS